MGEMKVVKTRKLLAFLQKHGFAAVSQKGSHIKLKKFDGTIRRTVIVPNHAEVRCGTLASIIRQSGIAKDEFNELFS